MKYYSLILLCSAIFSSSTSYADLVFVDLIPAPHQHPDGEHSTIRAVARFSEPDDRIVSVGSSTRNGPEPIGFRLGRSELYNQPLFAGFPLNDFPSVGIGGEAWDSYVTIGATTFPSNVAFTPGFLVDSKDPPSISVITECNKEEEDGTWYFVGDPPEVGNLEDVEGGNATFDVLIAQFTVDSEDSVWFDGNVHWITTDGEPRVYHFNTGNLAAPPLGDINADYNVNTEDLLLLFAAWGPIDHDSGPQICHWPPDFNDDGVVNVEDLLFLIENWCSDCA